MFYLALIVVGVLLVLFAALRYRRAASKAVPVVLMGVGILLILVGIVFAVLISTGRLTLPFN